MRATGDAPPQGARQDIMRMTTSSPVADALLVSDGRLGRKYVSFQLPSGAFLVIPKQRVLRRGGLAIYNPLRMTGIAAKSLMWAVCWFGRSIGVLTELLDELQSILADRLGERHVECAFQFGSTGIYSKTVLFDWRDRRSMWPRVKRLLRAAAGEPRGLFDSSGQALHLRPIPLIE